MPERKPKVAPKPTVYKPKKPGDIAWRYPVPDDAANRIAVRNGPAVDSKHRLYAALGNQVVALQEIDGKVEAIWKYTTEGHIPGSPSLGPDGFLRVHSGDSKLHIISPTGEEAFPPVDVGEPLGWASPLVDDDGETWICAYGGGLLKVTSQGSFNRKPFFRSRQRFDSTGLIYKGIYYVGSEDGFVYAISTKGVRGRVTWDHLHGQGKTGWFINASPAITPNESLVVAARDEYLYGFRLSGKRIWKVHLRGQMLASPVVSATGDIYLGVSHTKLHGHREGKLVCVGDEPHQVKWEYKAQGAVESTPVIGEDGIIYFGDNAGSIHAVDPEGNRLWLQNVGSPVRSAGTICSPHRVVFGLDNGTLVALQCASEKIAEGGWPKYMGTLGQSGTPPF